MPDPTDSNPGVTSNKNLVTDRLRGFFVLTLFLALPASETLAAQGFQQMLSSTVSYHRILSFVVVDVNDI